MTVLFAPPPPADHWPGEMIRDRAGREDRSMPNIGPMELVIVLAIALIILGPKRLPDAGRSLGRGMREFKNAITSSDRDGEEPDTIERRATAR